MILPNQLSLLEGDWSNSKTPTLVEMLLEIAEKATKKKEPLLCWNDITERNYQEKDLDNLNKFFKEDMQTSFKVRHMRKADNGKTIMLFGDRSNYSFELKGENEQAILTHEFYNNIGFAEKEPECVKLLPICYKDKKIYICKFKYNETLKHSLVYLWIIGTYIMNNYPNWVTEDIIGQIKRSGNDNIRSIFESEYIQQETSDFALTSGRRDNFKDIVNYIKKFQEFYFGFEEYLQHKRD